MASLTLKNVPDNLLKALRKAAETDRRSLNQEVVHLLASALGLEKASARSPDVEGQLAAWRRLAGKWKSDVDAATEAEQVMKRRSPGREVDL